jgi:hypothetical protein
MPVWKVPALNVTWRNFSPPSASLVSTLPSLRPPTAGETVQREFPCNGVVTSIWKLQPPYSLVHVSGVQNCFRSLERHQGLCWPGRLPRVPGRKYGSGYITGNISRQRIDCVSPAAKKKQARTKWMIACLPQGVIRSNKCRFLISAAACLQ